MTKLNNVQFLATPENATRIFEAFRNPYPSLSNVTFDSIEFALWDDERGFEKLRSEIECSENANKYPADFRVIIEKFGYRSETRSIIVSPYCGDRHFILRAGTLQDDNGGNVYFVEVDYSERPSIVAAAEILQIIAADEIRVINCSPHRINLRKSNVI